MFPSGPAAIATGPMLVCGRSIRVNIPATVILEAAFFGGPVLWWLYQTLPSFPRVMAPGWLGFGLLGVANSVMVMLGATPLGGAPPSPDGPLPPPASIAAPPLPDAGPATPLPAGPPLPPAPVGVEQTQLLTTQVHILGAPPLLPVPVPPLLP